MSGNAGSLCGMAAVYQAAVDTILTVFEIKTLTFDEVRNHFIETMERAGERISSDEELLENYHTCKIYFVSIKFFIIIFRVMW